MNDSPATKQPSPGLPPPDQPDVSHPKASNPAGAADNGAAAGTQQLPPGPGTTSNSPHTEPPCDWELPSPHWKRPPLDRHSCPRHCPAWREKPMRGHIHPRRSPNHPTSTSQELNLSQTPKFTLSPLSPTSGSLLFAVCRCSLLAPGSFGSHSHWQPHPHLPHYISKLPLICPSGARHLSPAGLTSTIILSVPVSFPHVRHSMGG